MAEQDRSPRLAAREHNRVSVSESGAGVRLRVRIPRWWAGRVPSPVPAPPSPSSSHCPRSPPAHRTRSRTSTTGSNNPQSLLVSSLLPLDDRDYAHSPYSEETVDYADSDHSLYSPTRRTSQRRTPVKRRTTTRGASCSATPPKRNRSEQTASTSAVTYNIRSANRNSTALNTTQSLDTASNNNINSRSTSTSSRGKSSSRGRPATRGNNSSKQSSVAAAATTDNRRSRETIGEGARGGSRRGSRGTVDHHRRTYQLRSRGSLPSRDTSVSSSASEDSTAPSSANSLRAEASSTVSNLTSTSLSSSDVRSRLRHSSRIPQPVGRSHSHSLLSLQASPTRRRTGSGVSVSNNLGARLGRRSGGAVQGNASPPPPKRESGRGGRGRARGGGVDMPQQAAGGANSNTAGNSSGLGNNTNSGGTSGRGRAGGRGTASLGSCASSGGGGGRRGTAGGGSSGGHQTATTPSTQHHTLGAVASTSSNNQQGTGLLSNMTGGTGLDGKTKPKGLSDETAGGTSSTAGSDATTAGNTCANAGASVGESSSDDSEVGRLQALLEARGLPPHLLGALGPRVQHLLHRTMGATTSSKAAQLLAGLQATGDEGQQLQAVIEMCQLLVMGNEDTLAGFPVRQVVTALIQLLGMEHNFDMMNHACRALTYMMEALPHTSGAVAQAVPAFLDKLKAITCMDVAEQSLTALDMLSRRHSKPILQARGVQACLMYLDFFSINAQRAALSITSNCCQNLSAEEFVFIRDSLPLLASRLTQQDKKSVESVCLAFSRLVESYQGDAVRLQEIASSELLTNLQQLLVVSPPMVSTGTFITVLRMLSTMCSSCPELAVTLLKQNIADTLLYLLTGSTVANPQDEVELVSRSPPELYEITCLIAELMPHLPSSGLFAVDACLERPWGAAPAAQHHQPQWQWRDDTGVWHAYTAVDSRIIEAAHQSSEDEVSLSALGRTYIVDFLSMKQINEDTGTTRPVQRRVQPQPANQQQADQQGGNAGALRCSDARTACVRGACGKRVMALCSVLLEVYSSSAGPAVRCQCLKALLRMVYHAEPDMLTWGLKYQVISSHIAGMMASNDLRIVVGSLQMAEILMEKLPDVFGTHFRREGVMHQIRQLADPSVPLCVSPPKSLPRVASPKRDPHVDVQSVLPSKTKSGILTGVVKGTNSMAGIVAPSVVNVNLAPGTSHATQQLFTTATTSVSIEPSSAGNMSTTSLETQQLASEIPLPSTVPPEPHRTQSPVSVRLTDVLKRKRAPKRSGDRGGAGTGGAASGVGGRHRRQEDPQHDHHPHGSSFRSRLGGATSKTTSFLASLNPARWARQHGAPSVLGAISRDSLQSSANIAAQNREKARQWVRTRAAVLSSEQGVAGGRGGAATTHPVLARLTAAVQRLSSQDPTPALLQLRDVLVDSDISPFEVNHSGLVGALLTFLTAPSDDEVQELVARDGRLRTFLNIFANMPLDIDAVEPLLSYNPSSLSALVSKISACVSQLEQFPVRVHDLPARPSTSALKFFNTHQLKCNLQRHPSCTNLKQWKGGTVKIDPLALVQAIERYLVVRGYARQRDSSGGSAGTPHQPLQDSDEDNTDEDIDDSLAAVAVSQGRSKHKLQFMIGDTILPYNMTVYQAVRQYSPQANDQSETDTDTEAPLGNASIWVQTHTIYYRGVGADGGLGGSMAGQSSTTGMGGASLGRKGKGTSTKVNNRRKADDLWNEGIIPSVHSALNRVLGRGLPATVTVNDAALSALALLRCLHGISRHWTCLYRACPQITRPLLQQSDFVNAKLAAKASRQLQDPLVIMTGNLPQWLHQIASACPFLFPFETRQLLFYAVSFDRDRALQRLLDSSPELNHAGSDSAERVMPRLDRRKRTVSRDHILKQAEQVVQDFAHSKALLEIKYENEVGTGLGPTLEFYALVSLELQRADLDLWHGSENFKQKPSSFGVDVVKSNQAVVIDDTADSPPPLDPAATLASSVYNNLNINEERNRNVQNANPDQQYDSLDMPMIVDPADVNLNNEMKDNHPPTPAEVSYVNLPCGLFPQALGRNTKASQLSKIKAKFRFLGKFMAKAVMDSRMLDLPFSQTMYRWVVGEESCLGLGDVRHVAPELWRSLCRLQQVALHAEAIKKDNTISQERRRELLVGLELDGCPIEELGLDFILPGHSCTELRRGGRDTPVTAANLLQYIQLVTHWLLFEGVTRQMDAFREGFESVFPLNNLKMFYPEELEAIFCGTTSTNANGSSGSQRWDVRSLAEALKPDHGFTLESKAIRFLLEILASYDTAEQRLFLQFITGSPRLPTGGFKALSPPLTVVRKTLDPDVNADDYLPSVMTCLNYLKLPDYSSIEVMRAKLRMAASEGQHSFHLS